VATDSGKLLSVPGIAAIRRNHRETGNAIQAIVDYLNKLPAPVQIKKANAGK